MLVEFESYDKVIRGWDNAPHYPEVDTYPDHMHQTGNVYKSFIRSLKDVLVWLDQHINVNSG
jgi:hypothetical protein